VELTNKANKQTNMSEESTLNENLKERKLGIKTSGD
jgi:hypothetical protein